MKQLIVFDMDGTLLTSNKQIRRSSITIIQQLQQQGIRIVLASGRTVENLYSYAKLLELDHYQGYLIGNNGQELLRLADFYYEKRAKIKEEYWQMLLRMGMQYGMEVTARDEGKRYVWSTKIASCICYDRTRHTFQHHGGMDKVSFRLSPDVLSFRHVQEEICLASEGNITLVATDLNRLEAIVTGINKASMVKRILTLEHISKESVLAIGDGENDCCLAEQFTLYAMENAMERVKENASRIIGHHDVDSIAIVLKELLKNNC